MSALSDQGKEQNSAPMEVIDSMLSNIHVSMHTRQTIKAIIFMTGVCASLILPLNGIADRSRLRGWTKSYVGFTPCLVEAPTFRFNFRARISRKKFSLDPGSLDCECEVQSQRNMCKRQEFGVSKE